LSVRGFEDADGKPVRSPELSRADIAALVEAFDTYLADAAKSMLVVP
jgi:hypothetical protein